MAAYIICNKMGDDRQRDVDANAHAPGRRLETGPGLFLALGLDYTFGKGQRYTREHHLDTELREIG